MKIELSDSVIFTLAVLVGVFLLLNTIRTYSIANLEHQYRMETLATVDEQMKPTVASRARK